MISVRYIVNEMDRCIEFYRDALGFSVKMHPAPAFAMLMRGDFRLLLSTPGGGGGGTAGGDPKPGGWNRFQIETDDLDGLCRDVQKSGAKLRGAIVQGIGGRQAVIEDPSGNPVELFEPGRN